MPRAGPSGAVFRRQCARGQNIRSPAPEPVQPYRSDRPCRRVGTLPKLCQIDACTVHDRRAQATPVPPTRRAMRLSGIDFAAPGRCREKTALDRLRRFDHARFNPRLPGGKATPHRRYAPEAAQNAPEAARSPQRARSRADASQKPVPRARRSAGAYRGARTAGRSRPQTRSAPALRAVSIHAFRGEGDPTPRSPYRARRSAGACRGARTDRRTSPHRRYAPAPPRTRQEPPRTRQEPPEARSAPEAGQTPARSPHRARAVRWRVSWRAHRPAYQTATALRAGASRQTPPRTHQEPPEARNAPGATRSPYRARAVRWRVSWRAHRPAYQTATALRAGASRQTPPRTRQEPAASAYRALLRFSTITDPVRIRLRRPGIA